MIKIIEVVFPDSAPDEVVTETVDFLAYQLNRFAPPEPIVVRLQGES